MIYREIVAPLLSYFVKIYLTTCHFFRGVEYVVVSKAYLGGEKSFGSFGDILWGREGVADAALAAYFRIYRLARFWAYAVALREVFTVFYRDLSYDLAYSRYVVVLRYDKRNDSFLGRLLKYSYTLLAFGSGSQPLGVGVARYLRENFFL